jgi:hypothetical protein
LTKFCRLFRKIADLKNRYQRWLCKFSNCSTEIRGRCYDRNFRRFLPIFDEKIGVSLKNQCYDHFFSKTSIRLSKKRQFFGNFF